MIDGLTAKITYALKQGTMRSKSIINTFVEKLLKYPNIRFEKNSEYELTIFGDGNNGFDITLDEEDYQNTLSLGEFHWHFDTTKEGKDAIVELLLHSLTGKARLKESSKKGNAYKYVLQIQNEEEQWVNRQTALFAIFNFWSKPSTRYLQNNLLPQDFSFPALGQ
ncbi:MAG: hypothetical protein ACRCWR_13510 [Saezia sp.]